MVFTVTGFEIFFFSKTRESFLRDADDSTAFITLSTLIALTEKMEKNEVKP